eukprot:scaffold681065_cov60-Prasinocladus_malaysianus.AAC.1
MDSIYASPPNLTDSVPQAYECLVHPTCGPDLFRIAKFKEADGPQGCYGHACQLNNSRLSALRIHVKKPTPEGLDCTDCNVSVGGRTSSASSTAQAFIKFAEEDRRIGKLKGNILLISGNVLVEMLDSGNETTATVGYTWVDCQRLGYENDTFDYVVSTK